MTADPKALVQFLLRQIGGCEGCPICARYQESADLITRLTAQLAEAEAEIARLREGLEACVRNSGEYMLPRLDQATLARARQALASERKS